MDCAEEEVDFNWEEYLEETGATAAPHTSFRHVELSLQSSFQPGMKLEVANKGSLDTYWVATIITTCGQLLLLRYCGYGDDRKADFWCDVMTAELHPVGWCAQNNKTLQPPEDNVYLRAAIKEKYSDWAEFLIKELTGSRTAPANLLEGPLKGKNTVDLIVVGCVLEVRDDSEPSVYWAAQVQCNVGGRLCLSYVGLNDPAHYRWMFYLDNRLRPLGWAKENHLSMKPPTDHCDLRSSSEWTEALDQATAEALNSPLPLEVFKDHADLNTHSFRAGMKLEMVSPVEPFHILPVSVTKIYNEYYFQITVDDLTAEAPPTCVVCHADSPGILPVQWCLKNGVGLERPRGFESQDFNWADYLKHSGTEAAPDVCFPNASQSKGFCKDMWLEAVNPHQPAELCVARITQVKGRLLWLKLEGLTKPLPDCIVDVESMNIFPVGWCEANGYPLTHVQKTVCLPQKKIAVVQPEKQLVPSQPPDAHLCPSMAMDTGLVNGKYCCSQLFINHRCFSGPYLNKGRIAELPKAVGPGKCAVVLKEILTMLINSAYKPGRVLRELQMVEDPQWNCQEETLKAKYKGKSYRSTMRIVRTVDQVSEFCRRVCERLQCCQNLFGPTYVSDTCPENCSSQTKTKYTYYKKRKVGRPSLGENAQDGDMTKPARRRKKRKAIFVQKKRRSSIVGYHTTESPQDSDYYYDDEDEDFEEWGSEASSNSLREEASAHSFQDAPRRGRPPRRAALQRRATHPDTSDRSSPRRTTRSLSCSQNQTANHTNTKTESFEEEDRLVLERNPLEWSVSDVVEFITSTDCASLAKIFQEQDIDGQALLLLTLPTVQECMDLKLGPAIKLCHQIERVKVAFYSQYAN
ncbi:scm-like with four MBT domains protein 2 isoform X1 [Rhinichthys klamathensis goyatoka]|uniref:scm-like with four MBT domains protein 2 isoform X1 n=1 Tax=Rhinichthys klamathensis goyatoka TaxID=3034132 RepID=UPI0024B4E490|nr:scm-like with four MBT domains protein 2 isoform X1 [Rhinichthys klamathensis goyatoka]